VKKLLLTGTSGFIGRNLKEQLSTQYSVTAPSRIELDLLDEDAVLCFLKDNNFDVVIHSATERSNRAIKDLSNVMYRNCRMFFNLARSHQHYGKMIYFGSGAEYDRRYYIPRMSEDYFDTHVPIDDYGFSKYICAKYAQTLNNIFDLRLFGVFGKYEIWQVRFISNACCKAVWDLPITINQNVFFDYLHIDDLAKITKWFIENNPQKKSYNICSGEVFDLKMLANKILAASGKELDIVVAREGLGKEYSGNNYQLLSEMGGYSFRDMDICIKELYQWYLTNKGSIERDNLLVDA
jgi:UDP-glucose 4-epimerase